MVSVIIPAYNAGNYIARCLRCIANQTYKDIEVLVIDDGSTDKTGIIADQFASRDERFKVFHLKNGGVSNARNYAIEQMTGELCTFVDADDLVLDSYIQEMISMLEKYDAEVAVCGYKTIDGNESILKWETQESEPACVFVDTNYDHMEDYAHYMVWGALYKARLVKKIRFDTDIFVAEDSLFFAKILNQVDRIAVTRKELYGYVYYPTSACHGVFDEKKYTEIIAWKRIYTMFEDSYKNLYESCRAACGLRCYNAVRKLLANEQSSSEMKKALLREARNNWRFFMKSAHTKQVKLKYAVWCVFPGIFFRIYKSKK